MSERQPSFWFPVKRIGWGWGPPVRWQGWAVLLGYFALILSGIEFFRPQRALGGLLMYFACVTALLIVVIAWKGERPLRWRSGR